MRKLANLRVIHFFHLPTPPTQVCTVYNVYCLHFLGDTFLLNISMHLDFDITVVQIVPTLVANDLGTALFA